MMKPPTVIVLKTPGSDLLQRDAFEDQLAAGLDHFDRLGLDGIGLAAEENFLHRHSTGFLHQSQFPGGAAGRLGVGFLTGVERGIDGHHREMEEAPDCRNSILNNHSAFSSNTGARESRPGIPAGAAWTDGNPTLNSFTACGVNAILESCRSAGTPRINSANHRAATGRFSGRGDSS